MNAKHFFWLAFGMICLLQYLIPLRTFYLHDQILKKGKKHLFPCALVDPNDPLRGKYIDLNFEQREVKVDKKFNCTYNLKVVGNISVDERGLSKVSEIIDPKQITQNDYVYLNCVGVTEQDEQQYLQFLFPFTRMYVDEYKASNIERTYQQNLSDTALATYAVVYVHKGKALIVDVQTNGKSIVFDSSRQ